jgi:hypothetical protein
MPGFSEFRGTGVTARFGVGAVMAACLVFACGGSTTTTTTPTPTPPVTNPNPPTVGPPDAGHPDGGSGGTYTPDAGHPDAGQPDAGQPQPDAGSTDAGSTGGDSTDGGSKPTGYNLPTIPGWQFFGVQNNGPVHVYGSAMDEGGNLWVAGGEEGLFLMTPAEQAKGSAAQFRQITMEGDTSASADAVLHPWGYMPDGGDAPGPHYLKVMSVAGGAAGTVFVGYAGKPPAPGQDSCETEWDRQDANGNYVGDPSVYKSGDADRVELQSDGSLKVMHYDIFSGPDQVGGEPRGRERVCDIFRIKYDKAHDSLWFGGNHGFAWGDPEFPGSAATNCFGSWPAYGPGGWPKDGSHPPPNSYGNMLCSGVYEHAHPLYSCNGGVCTYRYYGFDVDSSGNLWVGGYDRSVKWPMGQRARGIGCSNGDAHATPSDPCGGFWGYEGVQGLYSTFPVQTDVWADATFGQDAVSGIAAMDDGSAYFGSFADGIAHVDASGNIGFVSGEIDKHVASVSKDPANGSVWFGSYGGISILHDGQMSQYSLSYFGPDLIGGKVVDIQAQYVGGARKMAVAFRHTDSSGDSPGNGPDAVGIFSGNGLP